MADVKMSAMTADTSVGGEEKLLALDGTTSKTITTDQMAAYAVDVLLAAAAATPTTGDDLVAVRSGTEKLLDLDALAAYAVASAWSEASALTPVLTGDLVLVNRSGTTYKVDVDTLVTYALSAAQAAMLNIASLSAATISDADQFLDVQGTTAKKTTWADMKTALWTALTTHIGAATAVTVATDSDKIHCVQGGTEKYVTPSVLATYFTAEIGTDILALGWDAAAVNPGLTGDVLICERSNVLKTITIDSISNFAVAALGASAAVTPVAAGDDFVLYRSGTSKLADVDVLTTYIVAKAWSVATEADPAVSGDKILMNRSGTTYWLDVDTIASYALDGVQADVLDLSGLDAATLAGTDLFAVCQTTTPKKVTLANLETKLWADFATYAAALTDIATVADEDKFYILDGGTTPKYATATELATYVSAELWAAAAASSVATGNTLLIDQSGTTKEATVDQLATFVMTSAQATILDLSGLAAATLAGTDTLLICQTSTAKKATLDTVTAYVHAELADYIDALDAVTTLADTDNFIVSQSGTPKSLPLSDLTASIVASALDLPWTTISATKYTALPASTSTITFSDTSDVAVGRPVKYTYGGTTYYGIITAVSANALVTIAGAPLNAGQALSDLKIGLPEMICHMQLYAGSFYAETEQAILAAIGERFYRWEKADAHLVAFAAAHLADSGATQPKLNVKIDGALVGTQDSAAGITMSGSDGVWVESSAVAISAANYKITRGDALELQCTLAGDNGDADALNVDLVFVFE